MLPSFSVLILVALQAAFLIELLWVGQLHPTQYRLVWPSESGWFPSWISWLVGGGVVGLLSIGLGVRRGWTKEWRELWRPWLPSALPISVLACWWAHGNLQPSPLGFVLVVVAVLQFGWGIGRLAAFAGGAAESRIRSHRHWCVDPGFFLVAFLFVALGAFHTYLQHRLHSMWIYGGPDAAYYAEMLLNVTRGRGLTCEAFGHFFAEHFSPGLYLLVPIYAVYPHIETLMFLGAFAVMSGGMAVYALARRAELSGACASLLAISFLLFPSCGRMIYGSSYGFHEILVAVPLMLWSFYFFISKRNLAAIVFALLAISLKENVAVVFAFAGVYVALVSKQHRLYGAVGAVLCLAYVLLVMMWIVPSWNEGEAYSKLYLYDSLGQSPGEILSALWREPGAVLGRLFSWKSLCFFLCLAAPVGLFTIRSGVVLAAIPSFAFICLMDTAEIASVKFWQQASLVPVVWLAVVMTLKKRDDAKAVRGACVSIFACSLMFHFALGISPVSRIWQSMPLSPGPRVDIIAELHRRIPESARVQTSPRLSAHFVRQERNYPWHAQPEELPDFIVLDLSDRFAGDEALRRMQALAEAVTRSHEFEQVFTSGPVRMWQRTAGAAVSP